MAQREQAMAQANEQSTGAIAKDTILAGAYLATGQNADARKAAAAATS